MTASVFYLTHKGVYIQFPVLVQKPYFFFFFFRGELLKEWEEGNLFKICYLMM